MDGSDIKKDTNTRSQEKETEDLERGLTYAGNVFSTAWVRRTVQNNNEHNWFVLDSRYRFLLYFRLFLAIVYIIIQTVK